MMNLAIPIDRRAYAELLAPLNSDAIDLAGKIDTLLLAAEIVPANYYHPD